MACYLTAPSYYLNQCWFYHQWSSVTCTWDQFHIKSSKVQSVIWSKNNTIFVLLPHISVANEYTWHSSFATHYSDVIMGAMAYQITSLVIVYSTVYSGADQRKHQSSASLAFVSGIHRWPVNSPWLMSCFKESLIVSKGIANQLLNIKRVLVLWGYRYECTYMNTNPCNSIQENTFEKVVYKFVSYSVQASMREPLASLVGSSHDDVIKWKHFPRYWPFVQGIRRSPVNSPHKGHYREALMFSLICVWINGWVNNRGAGDLKRYHTHYDVTVKLTLGL